MPLLGKIGTKISLGFTIILLLIIAVGGTGFFISRTYQKQISTIDKANEILFLQMKIVQECKQAVGDVWIYITFGDERYYHRVINDFEHTLSLERQLLKQASTNQQTSLNDIIRKTNLVYESFLTSIAPNVRSYVLARSAGLDDKAKTLQDKTYLYARNLAPQTDSVISYLESMVQENKYVMQAQVEQAKGHSLWMEYVSLSFSVVAFILACFLSVRLTRMVVQPLGEILAGTEEIANGHFDKPIKVSSKDEIGVLADKFNSMANSLRDLIDAKNNAVLAMTDSELRFRTISNAAQDAIILIDNEGMITFWNEAASKIFGYTSTEIIGKELHRHLMPPTYSQVFIEGFEHFRLYGEGEIIGKTIELAALNKESAIFPVELSLSTVMLHGVWHAIGVVRDITDKKNSVDRLRNALGGTVRAIASMVETRDPYTSGHQRQAGDLARAIAIEMGLSNDRVEGLHAAAIIHDIGKVSVPAEILSKPSKLSDIEFSLIKTHAQSGYDILKDIDFPWPVARIVFEHHERMNGTGYPRNLKGDEILLEARILAVADVVEAMASHRPYRPSLGIEVALAEILKNKGILYDDAVVAACLKLFLEKGYKLT